MEARYSVPWTELHDIVADCFNDTCTVVPLIHFYTCPFGNLPGSLDQKALVTR